MAIVLFIDDDFLSLVTLDKACSLLGHQTLLAHSGQEALKIAAEKQPHLIVLDMRLPDMDGVEVVKLLRIQDATQKIPVVFLSAGVTPNDREIVQAVGAQEYLLKPISLSTLDSTIKKYTTA